MTNELAQGQNLNVFVQGASRGIGLEMVRQLATDTRVRMVFASCRSPEHADTLQSLAASFPGRVTIMKIDVTNPESMEAAAAHLLETHKHLHLLVNCAGILHDVSSRMQPEKKIEELEWDNLERAMKVNAFGPILMFRYFFPLFKHEDLTVLVNLSARVGSISDNRLGGWYSYRASKAAQNMLTKTLSLELNRRSTKTLVLALHPGTVDTDLSRPFQAGVSSDQLFSTEEAVQQLLGIIFKARLEDNGKFLAWDGKEILW